MSERPDYEIERRKFSRRLPRWAGAALDNTLGASASAWLRWPAALLLIVAGIVGTFLPILGF